MTLFECDLEARLPACNLARAYHVVVSRDLFGMFVVEVTFGRIGAPGRNLRYAVDEIGAVRARVRQVLRRRLTAPRRLGTAYRCRSLYDPEGWLTEDGLDLAA
ncbi:hypothetical protein [Amaricoccus macauensis]|uniref:hypothetical protein n=1 Tax=Amaricoccus macauensis TaxID=57001 RepID=UPI002681261A